VLQELEDAGQQAVTETVDRVENAGVRTVEGTVSRGTPYRVILDYVDRHGVDLVVVSARGRSDVGRYLIGDVTEKVIRLADCPVLTVSAADGSGNES